MSKLFIFTQVTDLMWINLISPSTCFFLIILTFPGICCSHPSFLRHVVATKFQIYFPGNSKMSLFNSWYIFCVLLWIRYSFMRFEYYYILFLLTQCIFGTPFFKHKKKKVSNLLFWKLICTDSASLLMLPQQQTQYIFQLPLQRTSHCYIVTILDWH